MEPIKAILGNVLSSIEKKQRYPSKDFTDIWVRCVKKKVAQHTKVRFFKKGKLYVNIEDPAWLYELKIKKKRIIKRLSEISKNKIKDVSFRVGDIHEREE